MNKTLVLSLALLAVPMSRAELPTIEDRDWTGIFVGFESSQLRFQFGADGSALIHPLFKDKRIYPYVRIPILIELEETLANGVLKRHPIVPSSLESSQEPTAKLKSCEVTGQFEGGASFRISIENAKGNVGLAGKLTDVGSYAAGSVRLVIVAEILNFYGREEKKLAADKKAFEDLVRESSLTYLDAKDKKKKLDFTQSLDVGSGGSIVTREAWVELAVIAKREFHFESVGPTSLRLDPRRNSPLHRGAFIVWGSEDAKAPQTGSFLIEVD
jgi:hypothetical protein